MTGIWTLKFLSAAFEKWNLKGLFFVGTFEKFVWGVKIWLASLKKTSESPDSSLGWWAVDRKKERPCAGPLFCSL